MPARTLEQDLEEIATETRDAVLDRAGGPLPAKLEQQLDRQRARRATRSVDYLGRNVGVTKAWAVIASETPSEIGRPRWRVRHACGKTERVVEQRELHHLSRLCRACYKPAPIPARETREHRRSRRKRDVRAATQSMNRLTKRELAIGAALYPEDTRELRPRTRAECADFDRPCPFVSCKYSLYLDVSPITGAVKLNFPDLEPGDMAVSCVLDVADGGQKTLEETGAIMNITRERIRQIETLALARFECAAGKGALAEYFPEPGDLGRRRLPILESST